MEKGLHESTLRLPRKNGLSVNQTDLHFIISILTYFTLAHDIFSILVKTYLGYFTSIENQDFTDYANLSILLHGN